MIWSGISDKKENKAKYKIIVDILANQTSFQNVGLRWVAHEHLRWLELWIDYRLNEQNYVAPPLYSN